MRSLVAVIVVAIGAAILFAMALFSCSVGDSDPVPIENPCKEQHPPAWCQ